MKRRINLFATLLVAFGLPLLATAVWAKAFIESGPRVSDFWTFWSAGRAVLHGHSPYPSIASLPSVASAKFAPFVYPPSTAFLLSPVAVLPYGVAKVVFVLINLGGAALALRLLGVRDWRCYSVVVGSAPFFGAAGLGTVSVLLLVGAAAAWRFRDRAVACGLCIAFVVTAKLFLWPLWFWLLRTRRYRAAAVAAAASLTAVLGAWAAIGFQGMRDYPTLLSRLTALEGPHSYSTYAFARALGVAGSNAQTLTTLIGIVGLGVALLVRGDERPLAALLCVAFFATPILWTHYLVLLFVPVAIASPRLSRVWILPLLVWGDALAWSKGSLWRIGGELVLCAAVAGVLVLPRWQVRPSASPAEYGLAGTTAGG